jgi:hypothetical protein
MAAKPKAGTEKDVELHPDAWERFARAVDVVAKSPPQHRSKKKSVTAQKKLAAKRKPKLK